MGVTQRLGTIPLAIQTDSSNNVGIGGTPSGSFKLEVTGASKLSGFLGVNGSPATSFPFEAYINSSTAYSSTSRGNVMRVYNSNTGANVFAGIELGGAGTANDGLAGLNAVVTGSGSAALTFYTRDGGTFAERFRVAASGNVGIGTSSPSALLTLAKDNVIGINTTDGADNGYLALAGAGGDGDNRGGHIYLSGNERGADAGTAIMAAGSVGSIQFRTGASVERMRISSGGQVLIGQTSASGGSNGIYFRPGIESGFVVTNDIALQLSRLGSTGDIQSFYSGTTRVGTISVSSSNTSYNTSSDYRLKEDLKDYNGLNLVNQIKTYDFAWKNDQTRNYGVIAHEIAEIIPYVVMGEKDGEFYQGVDYSKLVPVLVKAIQELSAKVTALENK